MEIVRGAALVLATLTMGLVAGVFYGYACSIVITLRRVDDKTFVNVMQKNIRDIQNGWFFGSFVGTLLFTILSLVLFIGVQGSVVLPVIVALVFYVLTFGITMGTNIPLNNAMEHAGDPDRMSADALAKARTAFENPWNRAHLLRTLTSIVGFGALTWALIAFGN
jgi:uncharacterized membrane protein